VSQKNEDKADAAEARTHETRGFMQQVKASARRKYTPEEKVRIVLEGFRRDMAVRDLCRREGIKSGAFYARTKDFMEAGKERLTRDVVRYATRQEIEQIKRENIDLKHLVADLSLDNAISKETSLPSPLYHFGCYCNLSPSTPLNGDGLYFNDVMIMVNIPVPTPGHSGSMPKGKSARTHIAATVPPTMIAQKAAVS
jgi:transposase